MPSYKLTYFHARGRGEAVRLLFAAAGVAYEDVRLTKEEWKPLKESSRCGQLPLLEVDGIQFTQSRAMAYYVAREHGLYPSDNKQAAYVDEVVFIVEDFSQAFYKSRFAPDDKKEEMTKAFLDNDMPKYLKMLESLLKSNGHNFFVTKLSLADIVVLDFLSNLKEMQVKLPIDEYPKLKDVITRVGAIPGIKSWVDKRPKTEF